MDAALPADHPTAEHLLLLRRLRRLLLRARTAQLFYLWGDDPRSLAWLQRELDRTLRARSRRLQVWPALADGAPDVEPALRAVLQPESGADLFGVWVDLGDARGAPRRDWLLARLNERRAGLLALARPVLLVGRSDAALPVAMVAPDLWSIRAASFEVPAFELDGVDLSSQSIAARHAESDDPTAAPLAAVELWGRALKSQAAESDVSPAHGVAGAVSVELAFEAVMQALRHRQLTTAERILAEVAPLVPALPAASQDVTGLRLALLMAGAAAEVHLARRSLKQALMAAEHAEWIAARLATLTGELPEALRDWSVSLDDVGDVQRALGDEAGARRRYEESLKVRERLLALTGESPEALRDWSVSLNKVGDVQRALGDVAGARRRYEESLKVRERLVALTGESPEALRDWSVSLNKVGDVQRALGDVAGARGRYEESLKVSERLMALTGESPEALRDLAISLERLGDLARDQGDLVAARQFYERDLTAATAALRQSPLSKDIEAVVQVAQSRLAALTP